MLQIWHFFLKNIPNDVNRAIMWLKLTGIATWKFDNYLSIILCAFLNLYNIYIHIYTYILTYILIAMYLYMWTYIRIYILLLGECRYMFPFYKFQHWKGLKMKKIHRVIQVKENSVFIYFVWIKNKSYKNLYIIIISRREKT